ncbi:ABC transporter substrate-binding protein [Streptomyces monomycini]|uniref:ABC transporter substrate-binding protein n=1 Tax=Streptomyces monomycini TaxID=371720 RepID=UPI00067C921B|nr:ABC transporter substrate-binding protein [Streptomyces monomycini]
MSGEDQLTAPRPQPRRWLRAAVAVAVAGTLGVGGYWVYDRAFERCADGVREQGPRDECVGVTDGSYEFDAALRGISRQILAENRRVAASGKPWVSVAYLQPMTTGPGDRGRDSIRRELEGAYLAQRELNDPRRGGRGDSPQIKLLLANSGAGSAQWEPLVEQLKEMKDGDQHLVAVAGLGQSRRTTQQAVDALREARIPMMGSTVTADAMNRPGQTGFWRVAATNSDQASAAVRYLRTLQNRPGQQRPYRVTTIKDRSEQDTYSTSLSRSFTAAAARHHLKVTDMGLAYSSADPATANAFSSLADRVCADPPDAVYFAGRGRALRVFIEAMAAAGRRCPTTVVTADDVVGVFDVPESHASRQAFREVWERSRVTVHHTVLAHPDQWTDTYPGSVNPLPQFRDAYRQEIRRLDTELADGQAMMGHDALLTLGVAIRDGAGGQGDGPVTTGSTRQMLLQISGSKPVYGVSGPIRFDDHGDPVGKPLALVELKPDGSYAFRKVVWP